MKRGLVISTLALGGIFFSFQNCSQKVGFGSNQGQSKPMQSLVATDGSSTASSTNPSATEQPTPIPTVHSSDTEVGKKSCDHQTELRDDDNDKDDMDEDESHQEYVACILNDHGKSLKLGLLTEQLGGVNAVSESVCITRTECLGAVAKAFQVEGAYERGYCEHNPHVKRLSNAQVDALLAHQVAPANP